MRTEYYQLRDDGCVPNNPRLPLVVYHDAFTIDARSDEVIARFATNGWAGAWINGIFDFHHYHARSHEVLANLGEAVTVQFGGSKGPVLEFSERAAVVIPAGGGHCRLSSGSGLAIVGAYPLGQEDWDLKRADNPDDYHQALREIPKVPWPATDPITGQDGPLMTAWRDQTELP